MSLEELAPTELAAVVTFLEMRERPAIAISPSPLRLEARPAISPEDYRTLFRNVGAPWLWFSRLLQSDQELTVLLHEEAVELFAVLDESGTDVGMLELDYRTLGECELSFVGLVPALTSQGYGGWLLAEAVSRAWARADVSRVHVHTCTLDHPAALPAYRRAGFVPYKRAIERFADPRIIGALPATTAPQVALLGTPAGPSASCA